MVSKIRISVGDVEVEYEGPESFLTKKLPALVAQLSMIGAGQPSKSKTGKKSEGDPLKQRGGKVGTLAAFLKSKGATSNQTKRFLATAVWLHEQDQKTLSTNDVTIALKSNQQKKLSNPADCLNKNVRKGFCEKDNKGFFVTGEGRESLG